MGCKPFDVEVDGKRTTGFVCTRGRSTKRRCRFCNHRNLATLQCDGPGEGGRKTCDAYVCAKCATHVDGAKVDFCPLHAHWAQHERAQLEFGL